MPCLILTGHPCAGKSIVAETIKRRALQLPSIDQVEIISEDAACPDQSPLQRYETPQQEKATRAALKSCLDRQIASATAQTLVILDSLNYIKGFRYELYCLSKAAGQLHGVVWVLNGIAKEWNEQRRSKREDYYYSPPQMEELIQRYEPPDDRNRWDRPLYTIDMTPSDATATSSSAKPAATNALQQSVYNMHDLSRTLQDDTNTADPNTTATTSKPSTFRSAKAFKRAKKPTQLESLPTVDQHSALASSNQPPSDNDNNNNNETNLLPEAATQLSLEERVDLLLRDFLSKASKPLQQGLSTQVHMAGDANVLHQVDSISLQVCSAIVEAQNKQPPGDTLHLSFLDLKLKCQRKLPQGELKRLRKQYLRWVASHPPDETTQRGLAQSFLDYIKVQL